MRLMESLVGIARTLAERASRNVVLHRRLPSEFGGAEIFVTPGSMLSYWRRDLRRVDPVLLRVAREYLDPGDVAWDVGANVGLLAFAAAGLVGPAGRVLAIEPDTWLAGLLRRSSRANRRAGLCVDVLPAAVSDSVGLARFSVARRGRAASFLTETGGSTTSGGVREEQLVPTVSLDSLLDLVPAPQFVKIDVEGAEEAVIRGATRLLREARPTLLCEVSGHNRASVTELLHAHGYHLYDAEQPKPERRPLDSAAWNTLALPAERTC